MPEGCWPDDLDIVVGEKKTPVIRAVVVVLCSGRDSRGEQMRREGARTHGGLIQKKGSKGLCPKAVGPKAVGLEAGGPKAMCPKARRP